MRINVPARRTLAVAAVVLAAIPVTAATRMASADTLPSSSVAAGVRTVTLITGDRVTVDADTARTVSISPGTDRRSVRFVTYRSAGHLHVIPSDALSMLREGKVDARLFDVTTLVDDGYDDRRGDLPLIVTHTSATPVSAARATVTGTGAAVARDLPAVGGFAVTTPKTQTAAFWSGLTTGSATSRALRPDVSTVWLDGVRKPLLDVSVPQIGAPIAWQAGYDGTGVSVAVLDTGIDATHPDLAGKVVADQNFTDGAEDNRDLVGHGTHVASTVAGSGAASGGRYKGVAPGAKLLDGKICAESGCQESWILAGMQWAAVDQHARVVNMSVGSVDTAGVDPVEEAVNTLTAQYGTLFVVAAGNDGADATIGSPGSADAALTVGAVDKVDELATFSSRGPRLGDDALKPDITAPGVDITAARGADSEIGAPGDSYVTESGTSMATPHVAGAAAILAQQHPQWTAAELKDTLMASAKPNPAVAVYAQGAGRVDVGQAIAQTVTVDGGSVSFGRQVWPHSDDAAVTRTLTLHNAASADVTLNLAAFGSGPGGSAAPTGMFTLSAATLAVPAHGQAQVNITADTRMGTVDGLFGGYLTATAGTATVARVAFAVDREAESYDLTVNHIGRDGQVPDFSGTFVYSLDSDAVYQLAAPGGTGTVRLPRGRYGISSLLFAGKGGDTTLMVDPLVNLTSSQTITVDGRSAKPIAVSVPNPSAAGVFAEFGFGYTGSSFRQSMGAFGFGGIYTGQSGPQQTVPQFNSYFTAVLAQQSAPGNSANSPYAYDVAWTLNGRMLNGISRSVRQQELATINADYASQGTGDGYLSTFAIIPGLPGSGGFGVPYTLPVVRRQYVTTDAGVRWYTQIGENVAGPDGTSEGYFGEGMSPVMTAGRAYQETWNRGVFGPGLPRDFLLKKDQDWVSRTGDSITIRPVMFADGDGRAGDVAGADIVATLYRDGVKVGQAHQTTDPRLLFTVAPSAASYRLVVEATRAVAGASSRRSVTAWTFRSAHVAGDTPLKLPLSTVRFSPSLDQHNRGVAGARVSIPITVDAQPASAAKAVKTLTVDASFDDGVTWRPLAVSGGKNPSVSVTNPPAGGAVSLRTKAVDKDGNQVEETILRAYLVG